MFYQEKNDKFCQCCLKIESEEEFKQIDSNVEVGTKFMKIYELFNTFGDDLGVFRECEEGGLICSQCTDQLIATTNFYQKCVQTRSLMKMKEKLNNMELRNVTLGDSAEDLSLIRIPTPPIVVESNQFNVRTNLIDSDLDAFQEIDQSEVVDEILNNLENTYNELFEVSFECSKCDGSPKTFDKQSDYLIHLSETHDIPCILCETCGAVFSSISDSDTHRLKHYIESDNRYECTMCSEIFPSNQALQHHATSHSEQFYCLICLKTCDDQKSLENHISSHIDQRLLVCIYCPLQFRSSIHLNNHIKESHDVRMYTCDKGNCRERFSSKDQLRKHQIDIHFEARDEYLCQVCSKLLDNHAALTEHLETHLNGNKFIPVHTTNHRPYQNNYENKNINRPKNHKNQFKSRNFNDNVSDNYNSQYFGRNPSRNKNANAYRNRNSHNRDTKPWKYKGNVHSRLG